MSVNEKVAVLTSDAQTDQRFESGESIRMQQIRSAMCAPLWNGDSVIGVIYVDSPLHAGSFSSQDLDLLAALANFAAVAIERARLHDHVLEEKRIRGRLERYHSRRCGRDHPRVWRRASGRAFGALTVCSPTSWASTWSKMTASPSPGC
jgi:GAF domain-containing protein